MKKYTLILFLMVAATNIIGSYLQNDWMTHYSKPLLMPLLGFYFFVGWDHRKDVTFVFTIIALFFSWTGDILLMFQGQDFFLFGLLAFLIAHITYMFDYYYAQVDLDKKQNRVFITSRIVLYAVVGGVFLKILWPKLNDMQIPVMIYAAILILMVVFSILRRDRTSPASFSFIYGGALLFLTSDGMIAVSKFLHPFGHQNELIMSTYIFAQFFIVKGIAEHNKFIHKESTNV